MNRAQLEWSELNWDFWSYCDFNFCGLNFKIIITWLPFVRFRSSLKTVFSVALSSIAVNFKYLYRWNIGDSTAMSNWRSAFHCGNYLCIRVALPSVWTPLWEIEVHLFRKMSFVCNSVYIFAANTVTSGNCCCKSKQARLEQIQCMLLMVIPVVYLLRIEGFAEKNIFMWLVRVLVKQSQRRTSGNHKV